MFADTLLPAFAGNHIDWWRWKGSIIVCAALALVCLVIFAWLSFSEEKREKAKWENRDRHLQETNDKLTSLLQQMARGERPKPSQETKEEPIFASNPVVISPHEQLKLAEEAVFVDGALQMPDDKLRISLGHDPEFRKNFSAIPRGKYPKFDVLRDSISKDPIIAAKFLRAHLVPTSPWAEMVKELFVLAKKPAYETDADFLFDIHLVNVTDNVTTVQDITAEAEIDGKWCSLPKLDDLSDYQLETYKDKEDSEKPFAHDHAKIQELTSLWPSIKGVPLVRGVGHEGWVGFRLDVVATALEKPINHKVRLIDAMGGVHAVVTLEPPPSEPYSQIRHSPKVYNR